MAIYHCSVKIVSRSSGRSAVGAAAYRSGNELYNSYDGITHDYTRKSGIEYSEIILPNNAPKEYLNREKLWNSVEKIEKNKNAQLAREVEIALPIELSRKQQIELLQEYVKENFVKYGMCVDFSIHSGHKHNKSKGFNLSDQDINIENPHAHILLTMRPLGKNGEWGAKSKKVYMLDENENRIYDKKKRQYKCYKENTTDWNKTETLEQWRENWEKECNKKLEKYGFEERIDHRSYKDQGINKQPTIHLGAAAPMEKRGEPTDRGRINEEIKKINNEIEKLEKEITKLEKEENNKKYIKAAADEIKPPEPEKGSKNPLEKEESKTPNADVDFIKNKTNKLYNFENMYLQNEKELHNNKEHKSKIETENKSIESEIQRKIRELDNVAEKMLDSNNNIISLHEQIEDLTEKKQGLKLFKGKEKKQLEGQIKDFESRIELEKKNLYLEFGVTPDQTVNKLNEIEKQKNEIYSKQPSGTIDLNLNIEKLERQKVLIELEYKKEKILIDNSPYKKEIEDKLKEKRLSNDNFNETIGTTRIGKKLSNISQMDLKKIMKYYPQDKNLMQLIQNMQKSVSQLGKEMAKGFFMKR